MNEWINQSIKSIDQSINQLINQQINKNTVSVPITKLYYANFKLCGISSVVTQPYDQGDNQSIKTNVKAPSTNLKKRSWMIECKSINWSINQSIDQSIN